MNDYYKILGLEDHPADLREAKKAYAKRLRKTRPDDDPEGFMKLREALNSAQNYIANREYYAAQEKAEAQKETKEEETTEEQTRTDTQTRPQPTQIHEAENTAQTAHEIHDNAAQSDDMSEPQPEPVIEEIEQTGDQILMSRLSKAFNDPFLKNDKAHWASILDDKDNLSIDEYIDFEERFLSALINAYNSWIENKKENSSLNRPIPTNIENLIFDKMEWRTLQDVDL